VKIKSACRQTASKLPQVQQILEQLNSRLDARSMIENGTVFTFKMPALTNEQRNEERNKSKHRRADDFMAKEFSEEFSNNEDISIDFE
jgi:hypothetical protein